MRRYRPIQPRRGYRYHTTSIRDKDDASNFSFVIVFIITMVIGAIVLFSLVGMSNSIKIVFFIVWFVILIIGLLMLVKWHSDTYAYKCRYCKYKFTISPSVNFRSPHRPTRVGGEKFLKCPRCHRRTWMKVIKR